MKQISGIRLMASFTKSNMDGKDKFINILGYPLHFWMENVLIKRSCPV